MVRTVQTSRSVLTALLSLGALSGLCVATGAPAATASATVKTVTLHPLSIVKIRDLDFGIITTSAAAGTVVIDPNLSARSTTGGTVAGGGAPQAAEFYTYGTPRTSLQVNRGPLPILTRVGGGATMAVTELTLNGTTTYFTDGAGFFDLKVGGTLTVNANQPEGTYLGTFDIIVTYH